MAIIYVRSTDGLDADNGSTWALAKATVAGALAIAAAGDTVYVSQVHAETTAGSVTWATTGTVTLPVLIVCANDAAQPPTALATTATAIANASGAAFNVTGSCYVYGISLTSGTGAGNPAIALGAAGTWQRWESCNFILAGTGGAGVIRPIASGAVQAVVEWVNCGVKFAQAAQGIQLNGGRWHWNGGSVLSGGTSPTALIAAINVGAATSSGVKGLLEGLDLSNCSAALNLVTSGMGAGCDIRFRNCRTPASWSGGPFNGSLSAPARLELANCDNGATNYKLWAKDYAGDVTIETTLVKTGGQSDGVTAQSFKLVSSANVGYPVHVLYTPWMLVNVSTTGSAMTASVSILRDSATNLKDNEIWAEVDYSGNASFPIGGYASDRTTNVLTTAADQASDSGSTWTTTGMSNPNKQKLDVTFTPQMKGYCFIRVALAKPSSTLYVDGRATVT